MKTIIISLACILFAGCATTQSPVPQPRTEAELAACKEKVAELTACKEKVAELEKKIDNEDYRSNMQFFDE